MYITFLSGMNNTFNCLILQVYLLPTYGKRLDDSSKERLLNGNDMCDLLANVPVQVQTVCRCISDAFLVKVTHVGQRSL